MKNSHLILVFSVLMVLFANLSYAKEETHTPYRITSYNLGAVIDSQASVALQTTRDFQPLLITSTKADILNNELESSVSLSEVAPHTNNTSGIALSAQFDATKKISLLGTFGMTKNLWTPDSVNYDNKSSWEANLGIVYKLINNFSYEMHFGYMDTGNLFTEHNSYSDVESIIMISNKLTLSF